MPTRGKEAWVKMKINHITDTDMVTKLYQASKAGVKIDIVIRGNCSLVPGIAKLSDNIRCVGIIDRYLEHSRILIFCQRRQAKILHRFCRLDAKKPHQPHRGSHPGI